MARVDEYMAWQHTSLRANGSMLVWTVVIAPRMTGNPVDKKRASFFRNQLENVLDQIENIWLKDRSFIAGEEITIADLLAVTELEQPGMAGYDVRKGNPRISEYLERVRQRLQPHYDDAHSAVRQTQKTFADSKL